MNSKISIIVPVYNVEKYLSRCIESLLVQTYTNFEIILVDDGSLDCCPVICDKYAAKYKNIHVIHKENGGLADARNAGMKVAKGEYVTFVDSDDYVNSLYLEMLIKGINRGADISLCDFVEVYDDGVNQKLEKTQIVIDVLGAKEALTEVLYQRFHDVSAWGILLPFALAQQYPFPEGQLFEDLYTTYKFYLETEQVAFIRAPLYYYFQRIESIMSKRDDTFIHDLLQASDLLVNACKGQGKNVEQAALNKQFSNYCRLILQPSNLQNKYPEVYRDVVKTLKRHRLSILLDHRARWKNRLAALALFGGVAGLRFAFKFK